MPPTQPVYGHEDPTAMRPGWPAWQPRRPAPTASKTAYALAGFVQAIPVPEPAAAQMLALGLIVLGAWRRARARRVAA